MAQTEPPISAAHICAGTDWAYSPTSALGLGSPSCPHLHRDRAHPYSCVGKEWTSARREGWHCGNGNESDTGAAQPSPISSAPSSADTLCAARCTLCDARCTLHGVCCMMYGACCTWHVLRCLLHQMCCMFYAARLHGVTLTGAAALQAEHEQTRAELLRQERRDARVLLRARCARASLPPPPPRASPCSCARACACACGCPSLVRVFTCLSVSLSACACVCARMLDCPGVSACARACALRLSRCLGRKVPRQGPTV